VTPLPARALEWRATEAVTVPAGTTIQDDFAAMGETITIAGDVTGGVYALARSITVTGTIERDLIAAAESITISGTVKGDLRVAGQHVTISGRVDGNVTAAGQGVGVNRGGEVAGSLMAAGQDVRLFGPVGRGVVTAANTLHLGGNVGGSVRAWVDTLIVDPTTRIAGSLEYTSARTASLPPGAVAGTVQFHQAEQDEQPRPEQRENPFAGMFNLFSLAWLVGSIIIGVLLVHLLPGFAGGVADQVQQHPLPSFGIGVLALIVVPMAALVIAFTVIGLPISLLGMLAYVIAIHVGWLLLGLAVGGLLVRLLRRGRPTLAIAPEWLVVLGIVVLYVLTHLPYIGGLATFVVVCLGLGALLRELAERRDRPRPALGPALGPAI
jgi:cytoskeletal protein CcmA (bactofilin family)